MYATPHGPLRNPLKSRIKNGLGARDVVLQTRASDSDWTARVLIGGLEPAHVYWYRFTDTDGSGSRVGRTITAPLPDDARTVNFAFVSCRDINEGRLNAYRRMIHEDERTPAAEQLGFVLHLGDFIYEVVEYPDEVKTRYGRTIYEVARIPDGHQVGKFHIPLTVDGYRAIFKGYLADPDLQDARARRPFVAIWDNHEFSWQGWQSIVKAGPFERPGRASRSRRTRPGSNSFRRVSLGRAVRSSASIRRPSRTSRSRHSTATDWGSSRTSVSSLRYSMMTVTSAIRHSESSVTGHQHALRSYAKAAGLTIEIDLDLDGAHLGADGLARL